MRLLAAFRSREENGKQARGLHSAYNGSVTHTNRLARESSPYLLQHAHNPVDWYPWGPEAFEASRTQNKPIFLSVGYSTCYWCHVMERQCFENETIAKLMNQTFIGQPPLRVMSWTAVM